MRCLGVFAWLVTLVVLNAVCAQDLTAKAVNQGFTIYPPLGPGLSGSCSEVDTALPTSITSLYLEGFAVTAVDCQYAIPLPRGRISGRSVYALFSDGTLSSPGVMYLPLRLSGSSYSRDRAGVTWVTETTSQEWQFYGDNAFSYRVTIEETKNASRYFLSENPGARPEPPLITTNRREYFVVGKLRESGLVKYSIPVAWHEWADGDPLPDFSPQLRVVEEFPRFRVVASSEELADSQVSWVGEFDVTRSELPLLAQQPARTGSFQAFARYHWLADCRRASLENSPFRRWVSALERLPYAFSLAVCDSPQSVSEPDRQAVDRETWLVMETDDGAVVARGPRQRAGIIAQEGCRYQYVFDTEVAWLEIVGEHVVAFVTEARGEFPTEEHPFDCPGRQHLSESYTKTLHMIYLNSKGMRAFEVPLAELAWPPGERPEILEDALHAEIDGSRLHIVYWSGELTSEQRNWLGTFVLDGHP